MQYQSKFFNIDTYYENWAKLQGWDKDEFVEAIEKLESLPRETLLNLCSFPDVKLCFTQSDWQKVLPEEEILSALISGCPATAIKSGLDFVEHR